tara:strand:+ start:2008 stop:2130 length:123 start_codon:yes stop_codon:yes gene_type:complete
MVVEEVVQPLITRLLSPREENVVFAIFGAAQVPLSVVATL